MMAKLKSTLLRLLPRFLINIVASLKFIGSGDYLSLRRRLEANERRAQLLALQLLQQKTNVSLPILSTNGSRLNQHELSVYSQNGEDGILLYLFSQLGVCERRFVEFGIGDGKQCNTTNLALNFGWSGLLLEANQQKAAAAQFFFQQELGPEQTAVKVVPVRVTAENINELLAKFLAAHQQTREIDLLSIDIDGNDYWVWQAITVIQPRLVVIEYNPSFGSTRAITVVYDPHFERFAKHATGYYHGASLTALASLGQEKGYILAGCDSSGTNAFFIRQDVAGQKFSPVPVTQAFFPSFYRSMTMSHEEQYQQVAHMPFQEIE